MATKMSVMKGGVTTILFGPTFATLGHFFFVFMGYDYDLKVSHLTQPEVGILIFSMGLLAGLAVAISMLVVNSVSKLWKPRNDYL